MTRPAGGTILITGGEGQLARAIRARAPAGGACVHGLGRRDLDITDAVAVARIVRERRPDVIVNAAAWTAVDRAESEVSAAFAANALGPAHLARIAREEGAALIQISTDCVFDGRKPSPYVEDDPVGPLSVYGASKLAGEWATRLEQPRSVIIRTSWLIGDGPRNFLSAILRRGRSGEALRVDAVQKGTPTGVDDLAGAVLTVAQRLIEDPDAPTGLFHYAGSGETTRHALAVEIVQAMARATGTAAPAVEAVETVDPAVAARPVNACLSSAAIRRDFGVVSRDWRETVGRAVASRDMADRP